MKIKLAILENDKNYLNRIISVFNTKYQDKFEVYSFTNPDVALSTLDSAKIDVLIANSLFDIDVDRLPKRCGFAYFSESADVETVKGQRSIGKFQKADLIYKQILSIFSEKSESISTVKFGDDLTRVVVFSPVSGGCGSSTMAASCAVHFALKGKKTLYLNLEKFGSSDSFFSAEGQFDMSDIIFALKSRKTNLAIKLESCVKQDKSGVYFYSQSKIALDMMELSTEDVLRLVSELRLTGSYDVIVLDMDFSLDSRVINILKQVHSIVWVGDGSDISNMKLLRAYTALSIIEQTSEESLLGRLMVIYNKFSNKGSTMLEGTDINILGGNPRYEHATTSMIIDQIAPKGMFDKIC